ncbi:MAG TPA: serine protein kinase RIO [Candidatus Nanopusillus sp.]|nr:serine protein kinase RIO [Candidatus Nanopusillus sp.]HIP90075.1 serine protein kinase RIO [Candidatus Nanopusillus sp.]
MKYKEIWKVYAKVFDLQTFKNLNQLEKAGYIKEDLTPISEGKEAVVFKGDSEWGAVAVKIYKVMNISYHDHYKYLLMDPRFHKFPRTRIGIVYTWVKKEYGNLNRLYKNLVNVPMPVAFKGNILIMEWIGDKNPAPSLHDVLDNINKEDFFWKILKEYKRMLYKANLVHGDFSEYNILVYKNNLFIIDVSQAIPLDTEASKELLLRDLRNLFRISKKLGVRISTNDLLKELKIKSLSINFDTPFYFE